MNAKLIERISFLSHFSFKDEVLEKQKYINGTRDKWTIVTDALDDDKAQAETQIRHKAITMNSCNFCSLRAASRRAMKAIQDPRIQNIHGHLYARKIAFTRDNNTFYNYHSDLSSA